MTCPFCKVALLITDISKKIRIEYEDTVCKYCGAKLLKDAKYCPKCNKPYVKIKDKEKARCLECGSEL